METEEAPAAREIVPPCEMETEEAGRKREPPSQMATEEAERQRMARMIIKADISGSAQLKEWNRDTDKIIEETMVMAAAERLNQENPEAEPIVVEALTKEERAALFREQKAWTTKMMREYSKKRAAEYQALLERRKTEPPVEKDPNKDWSEEQYSSFRENWNFAWAGEFGSFEDTSEYRPISPSRLIVSFVKYYLGRMVSIG
jgi:hypothetical protein